MILELICAERHPCSTLLLSMVMSEALNVNKDFLGEGCTVTNME